VCIIQHNFVDKFHNLIHKKKKKNFQKKYNLISNSITDITSWKYLYKYQRL